ncbi:unnamed protein product [Nippostrongylus brasiliensis]|uniref:C2H2-type domain-containing protein n=1 Tax=Nippostrongylus brasiliensis TaxID=27835 RepID=A0A0N4YB33_NIPBR|nr:unnamed protein product [Nippostrongylus brasiliensis]
MADSPAFDIDERRFRTVMSEAGEGVALKQDRKRCHQARDQYLQCLDRGLDEGKAEEQVKRNCRAELKLFENACPTSWVGHFIRKHGFERYKRTLAEQGVNIVDQNALGDVQKRRKAAAEKPDPSPVASELSGGLRDVQKARQNSPKLSISAAVQNRKPLSIPLPDNSESTEAPRKKHAPKRATPAITPADFSSLLSMVEPEDVVNHPHVKWVDFSLPVKEVDYSTVAHPSRFLAALRLCHKFAHGMAYIRHHRTSISGPAVLEAARLLAEAELRLRCGQLQKNEDFQDIDTISRELLDVFKSSRLPPSMATAVNSLLGCVVDPRRTVGEFSVEKMKHVIFRSEVHHHLACAALHTEQWNTFKDIMESGPLSPHHSSVLVFNLLCFLLKTSNGRMEKLEWYMSSIVSKREPLDEVQWGSYAENVLRVCATKPETITVDKDGEIVTSNGKKIPLSVPKEEPFLQVDFSTLKSSLNNLLADLSKGSGSVTKKEVAALRQHIRSWSRGGEERAVMIDSLNVFHASTKGFTNLLKITNRSEDDLLVLLAAMEWGPNAYVLSNDKFGVHVERISCDGRLSLVEWMRRRMIRFNRSGVNYDNLPTYGEYVQEIAPKTYFVPVLTETEGIPLRSAHLILEAVTATAMINDRVEDLQEAIAVCKCLF